jgi:hypothetical protein
MSKRSDDESRALALIGSIVRNTGVAFQSALDGSLFALSRVKDMRDDLDALETVLRRIQKANQKPVKMSSKKDEVVNV